MTSRRLGSAAGAAVLAMALTAAGLLASSAADAQDTQTQPNIVMVVTDDQTLEMFSKRTMPKTVRKLAKQGTTFKQAIVTTPTCCPSRASFITGQYAHNNGVLYNDYSLLQDPENTLASWLQGAGYQTMHVGKFMNRYKRFVDHPNTVAPGWDQWWTVLERYRYYDYALRVNGGRKRYGNQKKHYLTRVLNRATEKLVRRYAPRPEPFYLQLDHYAPHIAPGDEGGRCEKAAVPDPRDYKRFRRAELPRPKSFNERNVDDKPSFIRGMKRLKKRKIADLERRYGCALASLGEVDRGVAKLVRELKRSGELDSTAIIFVSDNGFYYGEHRIPDAKQNPYEEALRVPLVMRIPDSVLGASAKKRIGKLVANIDVTATILDLAGASPCLPDRCRTLDGRSLLPLISGQADDWPKDRAMVVEFGRAAQNAPVLGGRTCVYSGIRSSRYLYVEHTEALNPKTRACEPVNDVEAYDLKTDPNQLRSFTGGVDNSSGGALGAALKQRWMSVRDCAGIAGRDPAPPSGSHCE